MDKVSFLYNSRNLYLNKKYILLLKVHFLNKNLKLKKTIKELNFDKKIINGHKHFEGKMRKKYKETVYTDL